MLNGSVNEKRTYTIHVYYSYFYISDLENKYKGQGRIKHT